MLSLEEFGKLLEEGKRTVAMCGFEVTTRLFEDGEGVYLSTPVLICRSDLLNDIRESIRFGEKVEGSGLDTFLRIDEEFGIVYLEHLGPMAAETPVEYIHLLQEFVWVANEWRYRLDLRGRGDLVSIPIPIRFF
jgi:hypothetical protein